MEDDATLCGEHRRLACWFRRLAGTLETCVGTAANSKGGEQRLSLRL
jgi:hypothetical protein